MATGHDPLRADGPEQHAAQPAAGSPTHHAPQPPADAPTHHTAHPPAHTEYRIAHLEERLARSDLAELGMRIEARGDAVHITGTASTAADREAILRLAAEELPGVPVRADIALADVTAPDRPEELS
ncbi:BON domain-containing protein [Streptomyces sp. NPDC013978]|uniref:BON domain-containing protein n=1 Tax=Streptomyces sp. NPDC013978 TaxID=3364869 RepID=UPI0037036356